MKLLYKVSIVIILSICHFVPAIADKIQPPFPTRITDIPKHNKRHYHRCEDIKAMTQEIWLKLESCYRKISTILKL